MSANPLPNEAHLLLVALHDKYDILFREMFTPTCQTCGTQPRLVHRNNDCYELGNRLKQYITDTQK